MIHFSQICILNIEFRVQTLNTILRGKIFKNKSNKYVFEHLQFLIFHHSFNNKFVGIRVSDI